VRGHGEILEAFGAALLDGLEASLVEREAEDHHLVAVHLTQLGAHGTGAGADVEVVRPEDNFGLGRLVENPLHVGCHAGVARDLIGAHLHALKHDACILNNPGVGLGCGREVVHDFLPLDGGEFGIHRDRVDRRGRVG